MESKVEKLKKEKEWEKRKTIVFMSDFGTCDGAVSAMHGVADEVDRDIKIEDLTHDIPQFNIWEASYRLIQTIPYWAPGTVFVSVVDPGVGSERESVVALLESGHIVVTPDNGTLSHVKKDIGIAEKRTISEKTNRLKGSSQSYTFHGRDVYAYTGARLSSGQISFEEVGPISNRDVVMLDIEEAKGSRGFVSGSVDILDTRYGSLWTNIPLSLFTECGFSYGDIVRIEITYKNRTVYGDNIKVSKNFTEVEKGESLIYINSLLNVGVAVREGSFSEMYRIGTGEGWKITLRK